jgi:microcystin-dependent protein
MTDIYTWSTTAADNDDADSGINWAEFQDPDTVNNSARVMMARVATWRDDLLPKRTSAGSANAYTVTAEAVPSSYSSDFVIWFIADKTNTGSATLAPTGPGGTLAAKPLRAKASTALAAGEVQANTIVGAYYRSATDEFLIVNSGFHANALLPSVASAYAVGLKVGMWFDYGGSTLPAGFLWADGSAVSRTTYAELFSVYSTTHGSGNGSTTFNVPDLRGRATFGKDNMGGSTAGRITSTITGITGTTLGDAGGVQTVTIGQTHLPNISLSSSNLSLSGSETNLVRNLVPNEVARGISNPTGECWSDNTTFSTTDLGISGTVPLGGSGTALTNMPPALICNKIILALPAVANASALGTNGVPYVFDSATSAADPGAGQLRLNNATLASATAMYISETGANAEPLGAYLNTFDDSMAVVKGRLHFYKIGAVGTFAIYSLTGSVTDSGDYKTLTLSHITSNGTFSDGDDISLLYYANGGDEVPTYTVSTLPTSGPNIAIASDGRKNGEGGGSGTGVLCFRISTSWFACDTGAAVAA